MSSNRNHMTETVGPGANCPSSFWLRRSLLVVISCQRPGSVSTGDSCSACLCHHQDVVWLLLSWVHSPHSMAQPPTGPKVNPLSFLWGISLQSMNGHGDKSLVVSKIFHLIGLSVKSYFQRHSNSLWAHTLVGCSSPSLTKMNITGASFFASQLHHWKTVRCMTHILHDACFLLRLFALLKVSLSLPSFRLPVHTLRAKANWYTQEKN